MLAPPSPEALAADRRRAELRVEAEKQGKEAEKQGQEFGDRWIRWNAKTKELRADLEAINQESTLVANHPGWSDMMQMLKSAASIRYLEGEESAARKRTVALTQWSQKWKANGGEIYEKSRLLFNRLTMAEAAFQALEKEYEGIDLLRFEWLITYVIANSLSEKGQDFALKLHDVMFKAPSSKTRSELFTLLKKPLITLGFTEREKP